MSYLLFTREAGMLWASAKSVREERSKHRYALQDFSIVRTSLVRGKGGWKVTGTEPIDNLYYTASTREGRTLLRNIVRLLRRFLHGESATPALYDDVLSALSQVPEQDAADVELVLALRILHALGYVAPRDAYRVLVETQNAHEACAALSPENLAHGKKAIEHALTVSHL